MSGICGQHQKHGSDFVSVAAKTMETGTDPPLDEHATFKRKFQIVGRHIIGYTYRSSWGDVHGVYVQCLAIYNVETWCLGSKACKCSAYSRSFVLYPIREHQNAISNLWRDCVFGAGK